MYEVKWKSQADDIIVNLIVDKYPTPRQAKWIVDAVEGIERDLKNFGHAPVGTPPYSEVEKGDQTHGRWPLIVKFRVDKEANRIDILTASFVPVLFREELEKGRNKPRRPWWRRWWNRRS